MNLKQATLLLGKLLPPELGGLGDHQCWPPRGPGVRLTPRLRGGGPRWPFWAGQGREVRLVSMEAGHVPEQRVASKGWKQKAQASHVLCCSATTRGVRGGLTTAGRQVPTLPALGLDSGKTNTSSQGHSGLSLPISAFLFWNPSKHPRPAKHPFYYICDQPRPAFRYLGLPGAAPR